MSGSLLGVGMGLIGVGMAILLSKLVVRRLNQPQRMTAREGRGRFAVVVPARDESVVIAGLLDSIEGQTEGVAAGDVYVVVEDKADPTVAEVRRRGMKVIVRKKLEGRRRKGYALAEAIEWISKREDYDAFFFFDADNVLERHYFERMRKLYQKGYDIGVSRRRVRNPETAVAVGSGLIFTIINGILNRNKVRRGMTCIVSGTGFYLAGRVVKEMGTYPFHSLTEDYELSTYATVHNLTTGYSNTAVFYDEQPWRYGQYFRQRTRWVKGYFEARGEFRGQLVGQLRRGNSNLASVYDSLVGVYDLLLIVIGVLVLALAAAFTGEMVALNLLGLGMGVYLILAVGTVVLLGMEKYRMKFGLKLRVVLLHPLLLLSYVPCLVAAVLSPGLEWKMVVHQGGGVSEENEV